MKRLYWIDWAKSIGIFFIVWGHRYCPENIYMWIYSFHVPLFFFLSGYLIKQKHELSLKKYTKKYAFSLLIPYFALGFIAYLIWLAKQLLHPELGNTEINFVKPLLDMAYGSGVPPESLAHSISIWFLPALFFTYILHYIIIKLTPNNLIYYTFSLFCLPIGYIIINSLPYPLPYGLDDAFMAVPFFATGYLLSFYKIFNLITKKQIIILLILFAVLHNLGLYFSDYAITDFRSGLLINPYAYFFNALFGVFTLICVCMLLPNLKVAPFISRNTVSVFALQNAANLFISFALIFSLNLDGDDFSKNALMGLFYSVLTVFLLALFSEVIRKKAPILLGEKQNLNVS